MRLLSAVK